MFNIDKTIQDMMNAAHNVIKNDWEKTGGYARQVFEEHKKALKELAELRISGKIDDDELESELEDEEDTLQAQLKAVTVLNKATLQKTVQAATAVFIKAIKAAI